MCFKTRNELVGRSKSVWHCLSWGEHEQEVLEQEAWESEKLDCAGRLGDSFSLTISHIESRANDRK